MSEEEMYLMKTMCLAKKTVQMPTKEEHGFLLFCGLGARKWQVQMDCNSLSFKQAILNIYPRLRSAVGYNLWTLTRDKKTFERIPEKVNTPRRIRSYLGSQFTGCLIIVPISDILLMEEKREHLRQMDMKDLPGCPRIPPPQHEHDRRSLCLLCGKMEKMAGTGSFHKINTEEITCDEGTMPIIKKLTEILGVNIEAHRKKFIASEEICKKCLRGVIDISQMEMKLKSAKEDMINNFFTTTSRFNKNHQSSSSSNSSSNSHASHSASHSEQTNGERNGHGGHDKGNVDQYSFQQGVLVPSLPRPLAFIDPRQSAYGPPPDMYQLCSAANFAAAAAHLKNGIRGTSSGAGSRNSCGSSNSGDQINYVRNPDYRSRPGSDYAPSEVGSSSYISVSPPRCEMNGGSTECSEPPASPHHTFDQQSLASTFSFTSQSSSNMLKSKAQYKDYNYGEDDERPGPSRQQAQQVVDEDREATDYTISTTEDKCEVNQSSEAEGCQQPDKMTNGETLPDNSAANQTTKETIRSSPTNLSYVSSGPSPPSSSPGARSDSGSPVSGSPVKGSPARASPTTTGDEDSKRPVKKRKRLNNSDEGEMGAEPAIKKNHIEKEMEVC